MDKPTDLSNSSSPASSSPSIVASGDDGVVGQAKIDANKNDALKSSTHVVGNTSCSSNHKHSTLLGCGPLLASAASKLGLNALTETVSPATSAAAPAAKTTIPLPLGAPLPNVASSSTLTSTLQQKAAAETVPRFVSTSSMASLLQQQTINLNIKTTTGGNFDVTVDPNVSVENLKKIIAKKLKVAKDRIRLLHRERELQDGSLKDNSLMDGSKIILIPNVETGLLAQRPENTVMQALESLNDSQVNDFLSGKTPLNLSMRLGDHMMLIQLQLSTVNPANGAATSANSHSANGTSCSSSRTRASSQRTARFGSISSISQNGSSHHHHHHHHHHRSTTLQQSQQAASNSSSGTISASSSNSSLASSVSTSSSHMSLSSVSSTSSMPAATTAAAAAATTSATASGHSLSSSLKSSLIRGSELTSFLSKRDYESLQNIMKSIAMAQPARLAASGHSSSNTSSGTTTTNANVMSAQAPTVSNQRYSIVRSASLKPSKSNSCFQVVDNNAAGSQEGVLLEQSPIKSLSNLVSSSAIETMAIKNIPANATNNGSAQSTSAPTPMITCQDPIAAKLTSCLCTRLNNATTKSPNAISVKNCAESSCLSRQDATMVNCTPVPQLQQQHVQQQLQQRTALALSSCINKSSSASSSSQSNSPASASASLLHKTANNPIVRSKHRHHHHHHHHHHHYHAQQSGSLVVNTPSSMAAAAVRQKLPSITRTITFASNAAAPVHSANPTNVSNTSNDSGFASDDSMLANGVGGGGGVGGSGAASTSSATTQVAAATAAPAASATTASSATQRLELDDTAFISTDTRTLAEASRNLTQTLRKLSKEVFTNKIELANGDDAPRKGSSGAVIESMKNHGKGIYSGTFSGTLNPALQDRYGRPKRDISTVIHILNDLLSATPQYSRGARISFESPASSSASATAAGASSSALNSSRSKQLCSKHHGNSHTHCLKCFKASVHGHGSSNSSSSANCAYGECNGHYTSTGNNTNGGGSSKSASAARTSHYACCSNSTHNNANNNNSSSQNQQQHQNNHNADANDRSVCSCRYRMQTDGDTGEQEREHTCQKCLSEMDNLRTKSKLDQLRLVMQQRKQKREARKLNSAPYGARVNVATSAPNVNTELSETPTQSAATVLASAVNAANTTASPTATTKSIASSNNATTAAAAALTTAPPSEVSPNHIVEEVDTAA